MTRDCGQYRRWTRDCGHSTVDDQRLRTVQGMTRDCGQYRRLPETADSIGQLRTAGIGDDQRLRTV
ncbi:unnamed protein product [Staurois parvus]|uniref:Uncharacterized protein n=1 Tax=Staurois parvus TaxID=386267 RepID=A0ABN9ED25_9NEOB|nr:unnamed protein product [Staurois parvus]